MQYQNDKKFTDTVLFLSKNDTLYLSTDGYIDQNNEQRARLGSPKFMDLIEKNGNKPLNEQYEIFLETLKEWKGINTEQRDDITLIGLKLG